MPDTAMAARVKLVDALMEADAPSKLLEQAARGDFGDFTSPHDLPITKLVEEARAAGLEDIAQRAMKGEFDG